MANRRSDDYGNLEKAAVRTLANAGVPIKALVRQTGVARNTLKNWIYKDQSETVMGLHDIMTGEVMVSLKGLSDVCAEELKARIQDRALTSTREVLDAMKLTLDTMITINSNMKPKEAPQTSETEFWRGAVSRLLAQAQAKGEQVSYEDAVRKVIEIKPEARPFLIPEFVEGSVVDG